MAGQEGSTSGDLCRKWLKRIQSIADICSGRPRTEYCRSLKNSQQLFPHYVYVLLLAPKLQCASDSASSGQSFRVVRCQNQNMWALQAKCVGQGSRCWTVSSSFATEPHVVKNSVDCMYKRRRMLPAACKKLLLGSGLMRPTLMPKAALRQRSRLREHGLQKTCSSGTVCISRT